ncbi:MAG: TlpA family protein disulfide reductase [Clostridia bacterium]|nr:TlpA family protein disulfide reductase [Clostridia bacterium]
MKRILIFALGMLLLLSFGCAIKQPETEPAKTPEPVATNAPEPSAEGGPELVFDTVTLYGEPISSDILHEYDLVIVNCWAEWCGPCVGELPELERIHREYPNVLILGVLSFSNDPEGAKETLRDAGVTYPAFEPAGTLIDLVSQFDAIPTTMFFDSTGNQIADTIVGSMNYNQWKAVVEDLLP